MKPWLDNIQKIWKILAVVVGIIAWISGFIYTVRDTKAGLQETTQATKNVTLRVDALEKMAERQIVTNEYMIKTLDRIENKIK